MPFQVNRAPEDSNFYSFKSPEPHARHVSKKGLLTLCGWETRDELIFGGLQHPSVKGSPLLSASQGPKVGSRLVSQMD